MMTHDLSSNRTHAYIAQIFKSKSIDDDVVQTLRLSVFAFGIVTYEQAKTLILLEKSFEQKCEAWGEYYVTALSDFLLYQIKPHGGVDDDNSKWLIENIAPDAHIQTQNEFHLLKCILERAVPATDEFCAFVLNQLHFVLADFDPNHFKSDDVLGRAPANARPSAKAGSIEILDTLANAERPSEFL